MMLDYEELFALEPYCLDAPHKQALYNTWLKSLEKHHCEACSSYANLITHLGENSALPVRLFKEYELRSVKQEEIFKTMTSSGTTGQAVSRIYLDRATSARQSKALARIVSSFTGKSRMPMLVIDSRAVLKDRAMFSARGAGILGFSLLGRDVTYALDENMQLAIEDLRAFEDKHKNEPVMMFGFTSIIFEHFCKELECMGSRFDFQGIIIHGGGWKKMVEQSVTNEEFKQRLSACCGIKNVHNYYGMVEQTGSIFMECEEGHLHCSVFSDIDIINPKTLLPVQKGCGLIRCTSLLPTSYPGHILLTEDEGELLGEDDCPCGRLGKYFTVHGRIKGAEIRGCSDTYERR